MNLSIRKKLIASFLLMSVIPLMLVSAVNINSIENSSAEIGSFLSVKLEEQACEDLQNSATLLADAIEENMQNYVNQFNMVSRRDIYGTLMRDVNETGVLEGGHYYPNPITEDWQKTYDFFNQIYEDSNNITDMIRIFYKNGYVVAGVVLGEEDISDYKGDKSWFADVMNPEKVSSDDCYVSPMSIARRTNTSAIRCVRPIEVDGARLGLLIINFKASAITDAIQEFSFKDTGYAMLIDFNYENAEGKILDWPVILARSTNGTLYPIDESESAKPSLVEGKKLGNSGTMEFFENGEEWLRMYSKVDVEGKEWYIFIDVSKAEVNSIALDAQGNINELQGETLWTLMAGIMAVLLLIFVVGLFLSSSISEPIIELKNIAEEIGKGRLNTKITIKSNDEIGSLSKSFNKMAENLRMSNENLEQKVNKRTNELQQKVKELEDFKKVVVGREIKMIGLKKEIKQLKENNKPGGNNFNVY